MTEKIADRLEKLGIALPPAPAAQGNYVPFVVTGNLVFLAGQIALVDGACSIPVGCPTRFRWKMPRTARDCARST